MALDKFTQITKSGIVTTINFECHHLYSTGIATFSSGNISAVDGTFTGDVSIGGTLTYQDVTNIDSVGLVTARLGLNVTAGVSTFAALIDANGGVDISGGSGLVASTAKISDLTDNRVVIGGSSGELEDSANLTFDGSNLGVGSKVTVTNANADSRNVNSLGADINAAWIRIGDKAAAKTFTNGLGIKFYDQGTAHWSTGTIGNQYYVSYTGSAGDELFPSSRVDALTFNTTGAAVFASDITAGGNLYIPDKIYHTGDTDTFLEFGTDTITLETAGSERLRITSAGKVGIGTVTPGNTLHLGGTQGVGVRWHNYTSGNSAYHTLEAGDKFQSNVGGTGYYTWITGGAPKMTLTNAGRLGIGTAIPVGKFESYNTGLSTPTKTWGGGNPGQRLVNEGSELKIGLTAYSPYAYFLQANTSSGTDRQLTLNPMGGSVGIGLTNAQTDAGLVARYPNTHAPSLTWNTAGGHTLRNEGSELVFGLSNSSPHPYFLQARTSGNAAKQLVLNPLGGNVGIHETSPEEILHITKNDTTGPTVVLENSANKTYINNWGSNGPSGRQNRFEINATSTTSLAFGAPYITFQTNGIGDSNEKLRITSGGDVVVGGTSVGQAGSFGIQQSGHVRTVLASGSGTGDTLFGAISGVSNGFQINVDSSNNQEYRFHNGSSRTVSIKSSGVTEFGANGNWGANPRTVSIGSRTQNIFAPLAIARGEVIGGGTGPLMEFIHGPDGGTQRIHQLYSYVGDFRIFADTNENLELRGTETIFKDNNNNIKLRVKALDIETADNTGLAVYGGTGNHSTDSVIYAEKTNNNDWCYKATASGGSSTDYGMYIRCHAGGSYVYSAYDTTNSQWIFRVGGNGTIYAVNTTVASISDRRLKENIVDANSQWDDIKALKFKNFTWKNSTDTAPKLGLISDEVEAVSPGLVEINAQSKEDIENNVPDPEYKNVKYSIVWMKAVKALQEAQARIETLEAEVAALKAS